MREVGMFGVILHFEPQIAQMNTDFFLSLMNQDVNS